MTPEQIDEMRREVLAENKRLREALSGIVHTYAEDSHGGMKTLSGSEYQRMARTALRCEGGITGQPLDPFDLGGDAMKWAEAFCATMREVGWSVEDFDEGLMVGWFANAIEVAKTPDRAEVLRLRMAANAALTNLNASQFHNAEHERAKSILTAALKGGDA